MESLPQELKISELWKSLPYENIIKLCQTNREFNMICQNETVWKYLLQRDFGITYHKEKLFPEIHNASHPENARNLYLLYKYALDYLTEFYPIITQIALELFVNTIPVSVWPAFGEGIKEYNKSFFSEEDRSLIFSIDELGFSFYDISEIGEYISDPYFKELFRHILSHYIVSIYPNLEQMKQQIRQNCEQFKNLISYPTIIFVNKKQMLIKYDYDLGSELKYENYEQCYPKFEDLENEIIALL
jgi:hypothetical protein